MPNAGKCAGEEFAAFAGIIVISSYLVLFISFYFSTYKKEGKALSARRNLRRISQAEAPEPHIALDMVKAKTTGMKASSDSVMPRSRKALMNTKFAASSILLLVARLNRCQP